jgi:hypothetical protein
MLFVGYTMKTVAIRLCCAAAFAAAPAVADEETSPEPAVEKSEYLPPSVFPAVYAYYGVGTGASYDGVAPIPARARAAGGDGTLDDVGRLRVWGVTFDYYVLPRLAAELKLVHESAAAASGSFVFDYAKLLYGDAAAPENLPEPHMVREKVSYRYENLDYKLGLRLVPFPKWRVAPFGVAMLGGNSTLVKCRDATDNPVYDRLAPNLLWVDGDVQHFSFDWAVAAGVEVTVVGDFFLIAEAFRDRPFANHYLAGYRYHSDVTAYYGGAGWRFE